MSDSSPKLDVALLSEILREFIPYRVMIAHQTDEIPDLLADNLPHSCWYYDAWVIANAYQILSENPDLVSIERALLFRLFEKTPDETKQQAP